MKRKMAKVQPRGLANNCCLGKRRNCTQKGRAGWWGEGQCRTVAPGKKGERARARMIVCTLALKSSPLVVLVSKYDASVSRELPLKTWEQSFLMMQCLVCIPTSILGLPFST